MLRQSSRAVIKINHLTIRSTVRQRPFCYVPRWLEYVDMAKVTVSLRKIVEAGYKNDPATGSTTSSHLPIPSKSPNSTLFFVMDKEPGTQQHQNTITRFACPLKEKFGTSISCLVGDASPKATSSRVSKEQIQLVVGICDNLLRAIL